MPKIFSTARSLKPSSNISDAFKVLQYLFTGETELACEDAADSDDNALLNLSDPVFTLNWLFLQGPDFPVPFAQLAEDPSQDYQLFCFDGFLNGESCGGG